MPNEYLYSCKRDDAEIKGLIKVIKKKWIATSGMLAGVRD